MTKRFEDALALDGLSLSVEDGELVTILGPSGSGKSTALRVIAGLERPDSGRVLIDGEDVTEVEPSRRGVGMVFQSFALFPHLSVADNIGFGLVARRVAGSERERRVRETAEWLELAHLLERRPSELSGGERQRVALARGLVRRPQALLLDEPLSNLDARLRAQTRAELGRLHAETGITMVYVTHDQSEALSLGDRMAVLREGSLQQLDDPDRVYAFPANRFVGGFVGNPPMNFLTARVEGGRVVSGGIELSLPPAVRVQEGQEVVVGFRPEDAACSAPDGRGFDAEVELVEKAGHELICHLAAGRDRVIVRVPAGGAAPRGTLVRVTVEAEHVRLFDPTSGEAL